MKKNNTKLLLIIASACALFGVYFGISFAQSTLSTTTSTTTQFFENPEDTEKAAAEERNSRLLLMQNMLQGLLPRSVLQGILGNPQASTPLKTITTTQNTSTVADSNEVLVFKKTLKVGMTDLEVVLLQKALNEDPDTMVSLIGIGSKGQESNYFGTKTKWAVAKFQDKHYGEVLAPNGLASGNGVFGPSTRALMNSLQKNKSKNSYSVKGESIISSVPSGIISGLGEKVRIDSISPNHGKNGTVVIIKGSGMTASANRIIAGGASILNAKSSDGQTLTFTLNFSPDFGKNSNLSTASSTYIAQNFSQFKTASFPTVQYPICVLNDSGMSNCAQFTVDI